MIAVICNKRRHFKEFIYWVAVKDTEKFRCVTRPDQLHGISISDYISIGDYYNNPHIDEIERLIKTRIRP